MQTVFCQNNMAAGLYGKKPLREVGAKAMQKDQYTLKHIHTFYNKKSLYKWKISSTGSFKKIFLFVPKINLFFQFIPIINQNEMKP